MKAFGFAFVFAVAAFLFCTGAPVAEAQGGRRCPDGSAPYFGECRQTNRPPDEEFQRFAGSDFVIEARGCTRTRDQAECTAWVTTSSRIAWHFTPLNHLVDENGGTVPAVWMAIGNNSFTTENQGYRVQFITLQPGIRTRLFYRFNLSNAGEIQVWAIHLPFNRYATMNPVRWISQ